MPKRQPHPSSSSPLPALLCVLHLVFITHSFGRVVATVITCIASSPQVTHSAIRTCLDIVLGPFNNPRFEPTRKKPGRLKVQFG
ncbi:hypothetical protein VTL71DRAFT_9032 [Oculimacula yallundae]|uniref:Secreted protein n=1 Tax=Oculimacula yallundae TaxID=86028 RepID=A0ABR4BTL3_9HELO